jgi:hypothetical protein
MRTKDLEALNSAFDVCGLSVSVVAWSRICQGRTHSQHQRERVAAGHGLARQHGFEEGRAVACKVVGQGRVEGSRDLEVAAGAGVGLESPLRRRGGGLCRISMIGWRHERRRRGGVDDEGSTLGHGDERVLQRVGEVRRCCSVLSMTMGDYRGRSCASE